MSIRAIRTMLQMHQFMTSQIEVNCALKCSGENRTSADVQLPTFGSLTLSRCRWVIWSPTDRPETLTIIKAKETRRRMTMVDSTPGANCRSRRRSAQEPNRTECIVITQLTAAAAADAPVKRYWNIIINAFKKKSSIQFDGIRKFSAVHC